MRQCWKRKAVQRPDFIQIVKKLRTVLQSQKVTIIHFSRNPEKKNGAKE